MAASAQALAGIFVLDLSQQLPAPYATLLLAQLGADVVKVEPPGGDVGREIDPPMFERVNAGKRSVVLDLKSEGGGEELRRLIARSDVLVEGFRPGTAARLGAGYEEARGLRPDIVYCSLSGYGAEGPYRDVPGHDLNYLGVAGGAGGAEAGQVGVPFVDLGSGTTAALSIIAALFARAESGEGCHLDLAMLDTAVFWAGVKVAPPLGAEPTYLVLRAGDGLSLSLAILEDKFWRNLCDCLEWTDWRDAPALATHAQRRQHAAAIQKRLRNEVATRKRGELLEELWAADVPAAPVHEGAAVAADPQVEARGLVRAATAPGAAAGAESALVAPLPPALRVAELGPAPALGEHSEQVLEGR
jgi:crotonobetainyl-CoA:carnitine CoA-transferase CaiB-like acyl-CoA transferase